MRVRALRGLSTLWLGLLVGVAGACSPCHSGHYEVSYSEAYTSTEENCWGESSNGTKLCIPYTEYHPEQCYYSFRCDWTCATLDQGKAEAHAKHKTLGLVNDYVDPRCGWDASRRVAWPKR